MHWKILKSETELENSFFKITKDRCEKEDGSIVEAYYTIHRPNVTVIGAFTEDNQLILIDQYRHPIKNTDIELPAGYIEDHETDSEKAALRELLEETGYTTDHLEKIHESSSSVGLMDNNISFFIGFNAKKVQEQNLDQAETIQVRITPWKETLQLLKEGKIKDMASVTGILLIKEYLDARDIS